MSTSTGTPFGALRPSPPQSDYVTIGWELAGICNYRCSYCVPELQTSSLGYLQDYAPVLQLIEEFRDLSRKTVALTLNGGEPTLWPLVEQFLRDCSQRGILVDVISNGSRSPDWWRRVAPHTNMIGLSYHREFAHEERFLKVIEAITEQKSVLIYDMVKPGEVLEAYQRAQQWVARLPRCMVILKPLRKNMGDQFLPYGEDEWEILRNQSGVFRREFSLAPEVVETRKDLVDENGCRWKGRDLIAKGLHQFSGWTCWTGIDNLQISADGRIWRGTCREGGCLGSLQSGWRLERTPLVCRKQYCNCQRDLGARKEKSQLGKLAQEMDVDSGLKRLITGF